MATTTHLFAASLKLLAKVCHHKISSADYTDNADLSPNGYYLSVLSAFSADEQLKNLILA